METQLCRCNECGTIMIDENPDGQPYFTAPEGTVEMDRCLDKETEETFWGCPICQTDANLQDVWEL